MWYQKDYRGATYRNNRGGRLQSSRFSTCVGAVSQSVGTIAIIEIGITWVNGDKQ